MALQDRLDYNILTWPLPTRTLLPPSIDITHCCNFIDRYASDWNPTTAVTNAIPAMLNGVSGWIIQDPIIQKSALTTYLKHCDWAFDISVSSPPLKYNRRQ